MIGIEKYIFIVLSTWITTGPIWAIVLFDDLGKKWRIFFGGPLLWIVLIIYFIITKLANIVEKRVG